MLRRPLVAICGNAIIDADSAQAEIARRVAHVLIDRGCRIQTGGLSSLPRIVAEGAREHTAYKEGDLLAIAPGFDPEAAYGDVILPTGMDLMRNVLVASGDVVVAIGGGAGTLSEIALAWQLNREVLAWTGGGWSARMAGERLDVRRDDTVVGFTDEFEFEAVLDRALARVRARHRGIVD